MSYNIHNLFVKVVYCCEEGRIETYIFSTEIEFY